MMINTLLERICMKKGDMKKNFNYYFIHWQMPRKIWNTLPWWEKLRAIIFFRVLAPKSRLIIEEDK